MPASDPQEPEVETNVERAAESSIAHVAVKPPAFDEQSAARWFKILESMFFNAKITTSRTMFHHALANLPVGVVNRLTDSTIDNANYDELKKSILNIFNKSAPELFESIVGRNNISMTKPTLFLNEIRKVGQQLGLNDDFLKIKFLKGLPDTIRPIIVAKKDITLDEMAHAADCIMEYEAGQAVNVYAVDAPKPQRKENWSSNRSTNNYPNNYSNNRNFKTDHAYQHTRINYSVDSVPIGVRSFHENQRPKVCRAHLFFGDNARNCKPWCILRNNSVNMLPNSRVGSRSNSPARSEN